MKTILFYIHGKLFCKNRLKKKLMQLFSNQRLIFYVSKNKVTDRDFLNEQLQHGIDIIVIVAGDGSVNWIANVLLSPSLQIERLPAIAILPRGTGNDFFRNLGTDKSLHALKKSIDASQFLYADIGRVQRPNDEFVFINAFGVGLDAWIVREKSLSKPAILRGAVFYYWSVIKGLISSSVIQVKINKDGKEEVLNCRMLAIHNGRFLGGGLCLSPLSSPDDGRFELSIIFDIHLLDFIQVLPALIRGKAIRHPKFRILAVTALDIEICDGLPFADADGESIPEGPYRIRFESKRLAFYRQDSHYFPIQKDANI